MRRSKEIIVLLALLLGAMAFVLWYVIDRRARNRAAPPAATVLLPAVAPQTAGTGQPAPPVDLTKHDGQTIDFSSGQPVVKNSPEDQAAIDAAAKDLAEATQGVTFKTAPPPPPPPAEPKP
ncbi:hypothetical protein Verru16b_01460 [Lacunisphaera limnophila]|uniref:Uncharacterized protein n=1 Tax=Lacunisphaera limnophila TaxID=1838286 RepID=A0A1D8AU26_9BACT|nr:hypothetical protein [Lacunisphaera limnophila]AOS44398.1 hypothetical protein Verru16b_01460 [Lacunisphaera limnophila]